MNHAAFHRTRRALSSTVILLSIFTLIFSSEPSQALTLPENFVKFASSPTLENPGIAVVDPSNNDTIFATSEDVYRAPASVLKLFSMTLVLNAFSPDLTFKTTLNATSSPHTFILIGSKDPWITASKYEADKYHRAFAPSLINALLVRHPSLRSINLEYTGVYAADVINLRKYFRGRLTIHPKLVAFPSTSQLASYSEIASITSPKLSDIIKFCLLWSDNQIADRLAHTAAIALGFGNGADSLQNAFTQTLTNFNIPSHGLVIKDGDGLSHATRVSTRQIVDLLLVIKNNPKYQVIYQGLPTSGETGTLKDRFVTDAPGAIGLVHAKTGTLDTTIALAGFVTSGPQQYAFAIVADHIHNHIADANAAMTTIDEMLGTIAKPES